MKMSLVARFVVVLLSIGWSISGTASPGPPEAPQALAARIAALQLGFGEYVLGTVLTPSQVDRAGGLLEADARPGTLKFRDGEVYVVADQATQRVLALYQRQDKVSRASLRREVGNLMLRFGEPTAVAHEQMIYWAYGPEGHIAEEAYQHAKDGAASGLEVLATVKFKSSAAIMPTPVPSSAPGEQHDAAGTSAEELSCYTMISSELLLQHFVGG